MLFATARYHGARSRCRTGGKAISDTVGFVADLPTHACCCLPRHARGSHWRPTSSSTSATSPIPDSAARAEDVLTVLGELGVSGAETNRDRGLEQGRSARNAAISRGEALQRVIIPRWDGCRSVRSRRKRARASTHCWPPSVNARRARAGPIVCAFRMPTAPLVVWLYGHAEIIVRTTRRRAQVCEVRVDAPQGRVHPALCRANRSELASAFIAARISFQ